MTVIDGDAIANEAAAASWLDEVAGDSERRAERVAAAARLLNRALHALSVAAKDPFVTDVAASRALAVRIGYGSGDELADGRWADARQLPPPPPARREDIDPQNRVARALGGAEEPPAGETLLLRARLDLEQGRLAEAALGLLAAARASPELASRGDEIDALARKAASGDLTTADGERLRDIVRGVSRGQR